MRDSRQWWESVGRRGDLWYVATARDPFFDRGVRDVEELIGFAGLRPSPARMLLEIGCGPGRMTRRFAERYGRVVALDISSAMLRQARVNLLDRPNVSLVQITGAGLEAIRSSSVDEVFSYITLQHVPETSIVLQYVADAGRVLRPGGRAALQVRRFAPAAAGLDWAAHLGHLLQGRQTMAKAWRGSRPRPADLLDTARRAGVAVELRARGPRHVWILLSREPSVHGERLAGGQQLDPRRPGCERDGLAGVVEESGHRAQ